jgi:hypothetical protein
MSMRLPCRVSPLAFAALLGCSLAWADQARDEAPVSLDVDSRTGRCASLVNKVTGASWVEEPFPLFLLAEGLTAKLEVTTVPEGLRLTLRVRNETEADIETAPVFPNLELRGRDAADHRALRYCFPARSARIGIENISDRGFYSGIAPLQFLAADHPRRGSLHVVIEDTSNSRKLFGLDKDDKVLRLFAEHEMRRLAPGEEWILPPVLLGAGDGTWHSGLAAYREWLAKWHQPDAPRKADFRAVFNFRVFYPHHASPMGSDVFDPVEKRWSLPAARERDAKLFGGVDFVHLYGWAATPERGRVGDYRPWDHIGGLAGFRDQLAALHRSGIPTGLYLEGYLTSPESKVAQEHGTAWGMRDAEGKRIDTWGGGYTTMCAHHPGWQDYLAETCGRVAKETGARGLYLDQFGFLTQYRCSHPGHAAYHAPGAHMLAGEQEILRKVRAAVGPDHLLYTEEIPTDVMTRHIDGAYTAAVNGALARGAVPPIHLTRFALPDFKTIQLISESGIGDNLPAVRATFFNAEALYLSGDASLFSPACLALIRKTHGILREHADAFTSMEPMPLVPTLSDGIHANRFPAARKCVWTLMNSNATPFDGAVLNIPHREGSRYFDEWKGEAVTPEITADGRAIIWLALEAGGVGCIVESW